VFKIDKKSKKVKQPTGFTAKELNR